MALASQEVIDHGLKPSAYLARLTLQAGACLHRRRRPPPRPSPLTGGGRGDHRGHFAGAEEVSPMLKFTVGAVWADSAAVNSCMGLDEPYMVLAQITVGKTLSVVL